MIEKIKLWSVLKFMALWLMAFIFLSDLISYLSFFPEIKYEVLTFYSLGGIVILAGLFLLKQYSIKSISVFVTSLALWIPLHVLYASWEGNELEFKSRTLIHSLDIAKIEIEKQTQSSGRCFINKDDMKFDFDSFIDPFSGDSLSLRAVNGKCYLTSLGPNYREDSIIIYPNKKSLVVFRLSGYWSYLILEKLAYQLGQYEDDSSVDFGVEINTKKG